MRPYIYEFSILEPVHTNEEFAEKVREPVYDTLLSFFSFKRLIAIHYIDKFAKAGKFTEVGRYTLVLLFFDRKVTVRLTRKI